jgi:hypothetical protein
MRATRARLIFSSEARALRRSGDPLTVRTSPFDTVQNNADNSLSLRFCNSWFEISFIIVFLLCSRPRHGAFHEEASARQADGLSTNCTVTRRGLLVDRTDDFGQRPFSKRHLRDKTKKENNFTDF